MSEKRKDSKGRILRNGESQRTNGQYIYQYTDADGRRKTVYSWTLVPSDKTPAGKKQGESLREKEQVISKNLSNGFISQSNVTIESLVTDYVSTYKTGLKLSSLNNFTRCTDVLSKTTMWTKKITSVNRREAKNFILSLYKSHGVVTVGRIKNLLKSSYDQAIDDELVSKNPFAFTLPEQKNKEKRNAIPVEATDALIEFTSNGKRYQFSHVVVVLLLETGMRIGELLGLRTTDIDLDKRVIKVDHQLLFNARRSSGKVGFYIETPKTMSGNRLIPISDAAMNALKIVYSAREANLERLRSNGLDQPVVDGYTDFVFITRNGTPSSDVCVRDSIHRACAACERHCNITLPNITPHIIRHTFCTRLVNSGMNPKSVQYLMGHCNVDTTLNVYSHVDSKVAMSDMKRLLGIESE